MKTFRSKKVIGWKVVDEQYRENFELKLNELMDKYEFIDCQYAIRKNGAYSALVLLAEKDAE